MRVPTSRWLLCCTASVLGTACNADQHDQHSAQPITYRIQASSEKTSGASSPVGYWVQEHSYPVFSGQNDNAEVAAQLNAAVATLKEDYRCSGGGDESFQMDVETLEKGLVSLSYTAMWHCSTMPSPDSEAGAINRNLPGLSELAFETQFAGKRHYSKTGEKVQQRYTREIARAEEADRCPSTPDWDYFTVTPDTVEFHFNTSEPSEPGCRVTVRLSREQLQEALSPESPL